MAGEWKNVTVEQACALIADCPHSTPKWTDDGVIVLRNTYLKDGRLDLSDVRFTDEENYLKRTKRATPQGGDLVISREAPMGEVAIIPDGLKVCLGQRLVLLRPDPKVCDSRFMLYSFVGGSLRRQVMLHDGTGSTVSNLRIPALKQLEIALPPIKEQRAIAHILGTLDDKIELNRRMNETLEEMARAIFKSWFVDFDPVRAKAEGRDPGLPEHIADLFPDRFEDSELGKIPDGWKSDNLGNLIDFAYGKALKQGTRKAGEIPVFGSNGQVGWHDEWLVEGPGIVVGRKGNPGFVTWSPTDFFPIDTTFYVVSRDERLSLTFLFYALKTHNLSSLAADSAVPGLNRNFAYQNQQIVPSASILDVFDSVIKLLFQSMHKADEETRTLADIRDALLPRLISGELRVEETGESREALAERR